MTAAEIEIRFNEADKLAGEEKLQEMRVIFKNLSDLERSLALDFSVPIQEVRHLRELIPLVEGSINRINAGLRRRKPKNQND